MTVLASYIAEGSIALRYNMKMMGQDVRATKNDAYVLPVTTNDNFISQNYSPTKPALSEQLLASMPDASTGMVGRVSALHCNIP